MKHAKVGLKRPARGPLARTPLGASANLLLAASLGLASGCGGRAASDREPIAPPVAVAVLHVGAARTGPGLILPGRVKAREEVTLNALFPARLTALPVPEGGRFARGQALARFDAPEARSGLEAARAALAAADLGLEHARLQEARMDSLFAARVTSKRDLELAQSARRAAEADRSAAAASLAAWTTNTTIPAPFAGVVVRHRADPGATVGPGQPLLDIRSQRAGEIEVPVPESEVEAARGARAWFQLGQGPWRAARLLRMDGMTDFNTRTRMAYLEAADRGTLEPGAYARVRFAAPVIPAGASVVVPDSCVVRRGALTGVYVIKGGHAELRWLRLGRADEGWVQVLAGLAAGEDVALSPVGLADGAAVIAR